MRAVDDPVVLARLARITRTAMERGRLRREAEAAAAKAATNNAVPAGKRS